MVGARDQGLFEENGMTISEIVSFSGGGATVRGLTTGGIGIGGAALSAGVKAYQSGSPLKIIGLYLSSTDIEFHTRPDESFSSIQDLQGEKVGVSTPGSSGEAALIRAVQEAEEITLDDIDITYTGGLGESQTQLSEGAVAASWTLQPVATQTINNNETKRVFKAREYVDHYTQFALAASDKMLNENRELVEAYVRGIADGHSFAKENPEEAARAWAEVADIPDQLAVDSVHAMEPDVMYNITPQREILTSTARAMIEQGAISEQPDWDSIVDQSVLPESLRADDF
jgi:NitT/TauT family transport system substrate-binding protein